jgi:ElaB/YqjD/DUF883 family membrane-anchored ribosome-binding protein
MDTTREVMASGNEVESAAFHEPVNPTVYTLERGGVRGRIDALRCSLSQRGSAVKQSIASAKMSMRDNAKNRVSRVQSSMHDSPMKWAGIAAGSGFAIGMIGRLLQARRNRLSRMPQLVIIESTC